MPAWSPSDLTNPSFVKTQLSDKDRSNALFTTSNQLKSAETRAAEQEAAMLAAQEAQKNGPGRGEIRALFDKSRDPTLTADERAQAFQQGEALADQRDKLNVAAANAQEKFNNTKQYVNDLQAGQSNLLAVGTVPPGTSLFAPPPGYEGRNSPAQDVPASQNPSATPPQTTEELQSASPALINPATDPNTNIGTEGQDLVYDPLQEPPITNDGDEFSGIDEQVQRQKDLEDGSLEFAGIDEQIGINENALQEPPLLSDEEIDQQIQLAAQDEQIENKDPADIGEEDPFEAARLRAGEEYDRTTGLTEQDIFAAEGVTNAKGLQGKLENARAQQITQDAENAKTQGDWRVRLSLAPSAGYLYKAQNPGILGPLQKTDGVIFPYTPSIQVTYAAHYDASDITHSNYKIFQYKNSSVDQLNITCDFTAQDTEEANYLLAVIHFFRSVTKMFYGQDQIPKPGTPPPLCYLSGMGEFQFDRHPLAISSFNYSLPNDVDYIRASSPTLLSGVNSTGYNDNRNSDLTPQQVRMQQGSTPLNAGATQSATKFNNPTNTEPTYVPTKIQISLVAYPIVTRNDISNNFSLEKYATGKLLQGRKNPGGGGIW